MQQQSAARVIEMVPEPPCDIAALDAQVDALLAAPAQPMLGIMLNKAAAWFDELPAAVEDRSTARSQGYNEFRAAF